MSGPYFSNYFYLLESLSTVKSVVLITDFSNSDDLMLHIFSDFFDMIRLGNLMPATNENHISNSFFDRPDHSKNVYLCMLDILHQLVEESEYLSQEVVDVILNQFTRKRQVRCVALTKTISAQ
jgi:sister-chromatid-cohesion protein PDS5